jgi:hypothetical protein
LNMNLGMQQNCLDLQNILIHQKIEAVQTLNPKNIKIAQ